jgi:hypothetical protein
MLKKVVLAAVLVVSNLAAASPPPPPIPASAYRAVQLVPTHQQGSPVVIEIFGGADLEIHDGFTIYTTRPQKTLRRNPGASEHGMQIVRIQLLKTPSVPFLEEGWGNAALDVRFARTNDDTIVVDEVDYIADNPENEMEVRKYTASSHTSESVLRGIFRMRAMKN